MSQDSINSLGSATYKTEAILDTARLLLKATQIFGDQDRSTEWLQSPVPALGKAQPFEVIDTFEGRKWINQVLTQIEFGGLV